jgi:hypothetical protein
MTRIHRGAIPKEKLADYIARAKRQEGEFLEFDDPPPSGMAGLGDLVERIIRRVLTPIHSWSGRLLAGFCGCSARKRWLNRVVPFRR